MQILLCSGLAVAVGVIIVVYATGGGRERSGLPSEPAVPSGPTPEEVEGKLQNGSLYFDLLSSAAVSAAVCVRDGAHAGDPVFRCEWTRNDGVTVSERWKLEGGRVARVSDGGQELAPPATSQEASARVTEVVRDRADGTADCSEAGELVGASGQRIPQPHTFTCTFYTEAGTPVVLEGSIFRAKWQWNDDGSVAQEKIDVSSSGP